MTTTVGGEERPFPHTHPRTGTRGQATSWEAPGQLSGLWLGPLSWIPTPTALPRPRQAKVS